MRQVVTIPIEEPTEESDIRQRFYGVDDSSAARAVDCVQNEAGDWAIVVSLVQIDNVASSVEVRYMPMVALVAAEPDKRTATILEGFRLLRVIQFASGNFFAVTVIDD